MRKLWSWLLDEQHRAIALVLVTVLGGVGSAVVWFHDTLFAEPETPGFAEVCPPAQGDVDPEVASAIQLHATGLVLQAKGGAWPGEPDVRRVYKTVWEKHGDVESEYELRSHLLMHFCQQIFADAVLEAEKKNTLHTLCYTALISEDTAERLPELKAAVREALAKPEPASLTVATSANPAILSGGWSGKYFYRAGTQYESHPPVDFRLRLARDGRELYGATFEPRTFNYAPSDVPELIAMIRGRIQDTGLIRFEKTYIGMAGASHTIVYEGSWNPRTGAIEGKWQSENSPSWWGRFVMTKTSDPMELSGIPL